MFWILLAHPCIVCVPIRYIQITIETYLIISVENCKSLDSLNFHHENYYIILYVFLTFEIRISDRSLALTFYVYWYIALWWLIKKNHFDFFIYTMYDLFMRLNITLVFMVYIQIQKQNSSVEWFYFSRDQSEYLCVLEIENHCKSSSAVQINNKKLLETKFICHSNRIIWCNDASFSFQNKLCGE